MMSGVSSTMILDYYKESHQPLLTSFQCLSWGFLLTLLLVSGFYLITPSHMRNWSRDHPTIIKLRFLSILVTSVVSTLWFILYINYKFYGNKLLEFEYFSFFEIMGLDLTKVKLVKSLKAFLLTIILFLGPLSDMYFSKTLPFQTFFSWREDFYQEFTSLQGIRSYVVGPLAEEYVFRSLLVPLFRFGRFGEPFIIFFVPIYFGLAHIHHAIEKYHQGQPVRSVLLMTILQLSYTTLFGWYSTFLFLKTESFYAPWWSHTFCNIMGLPRLPAESHSKPVQKVIISLYIVGLVIFLLYLPKLAK